MEKFWNCFAEVIRNLLDHTNEGFWQRYKSLDKTLLRREFATVFPNIWDKQTNQIKRLSNSLMTDELINVFCEYMEGCEKKGKNDNMVYSLYQFDYGLEALIHTYQGRGIVEKAQTLNRNEKKTQIQLIGRTTCFWERRSRGSQHRLSLGSYLKNCMFIDKKEMNGFCIQHYYGQDGLFRHAMIRKKLRIGFSPLASENCIQIKEFSCLGERKFQARCVRNYGDRLCAALRRAEEKGIDILFFPEMLGTQSAQQQVQRYLREEWIATGRRYPDLVILPTIWKDRKNVAVVLDQKGDVIFKQEKQYPYFLERENGELREDIDPNRKINVLHCEGLGRMMILICKDFLEMDHLNRLLKWIRPTILFIPSFSTGFYDFENMANLCKPYDCHVFWINSCAAEHYAGMNKKENFDTIALAAIHGKRGYNREKICRQERCRAENNICESTCLFDEEIRFE